MHRPRASRRVRLHAFPPTVSQTDREMARQTGQEAERPRGKVRDGSGGDWPPGTDKVETLRLLRADKAPWLAAGLRPGQVKAGLPHLDIFKGVHR